MLNFVQWCFLQFYYDDYWFFSFILLIWWVALHFWNKSNLITMYSFFVSGLSLDSWMIYTKKLLKLFCKDMSFQMGLKTILFLLDWIFSLQLSLHWQLDQTSCCLNINNILIFVDEELTIFSTIFSEELNFLLELESRICVYCTLLEIIEILYYPLSLTVLLCFLTNVT